MKILPFAVSGIAGGLIAFAMSEFGLVSDMPHFVIGGLIAGIAGAAIANVLIFIANKIIERNHAAIWKKSKADAEAFWDGFEDGMKDADRYL